MRWVSRLLALALALTAISIRAQNGEIHIYRDATGARLYTDKKINFKVEKGGVDYAYVGKYGRPTAVLSCVGFSAAGLEARGTQYQMHIDEYSKKFAIDPALVKAVMRVESCFDSAAVSRVGAQGLMQLMPDRAMRLGVADSFDPGENIRGGTQFLSNLLKRFDGNIEYALAAYNAGPLTVERYKGIPPYKETRAYVKRVMTHYKRYSS